MRRETLGRLLELALWTALVALAAAVTFQKIYSSDYWWHMVVGGQILETGSVPKTDQLSYTATGEPYLDIHWLFQIVLHGFYRLGGHTAAIWLKFGCVLAMLACLARIGFRRERTSLSVAVLALVLLSGGYRFMPRPELFSFVLLAAVLALFDHYRSHGGRWVYAVVGVQLIWVNCHGLFALGIAVGLIYWVDEVVLALRDEAGPQRWERVWCVTTVVALSVGISVVNPNLLDGALYPLRQLQMLGSPQNPTEFSRLIVELYSPFHPRSAVTPLAASFPVALALIAAAGVGLNGRGRRLSDFLLLVAFGYLALTAQRNIPLFAIAAAPVAIRNWNEWLDGRAPLPRGRWIGAGLTFVVLVGFTVDIARDRFYERLGGLRETGFGVVERRFPIGAAEWIAEHHPPGPIYHGQAVGGYLLWRLYPEYRSYLDGRLEVFGLRKLVGLRARDYEAFRVLDEHFRFGIVLLPNSGDAPLHYGLYLSPSWRLEYADEVASVFVRVSQEWSPREAEVDIDADDLFAPLGESRSVEDRELRRMRINFYTATRRYRRALQELDEAVARYPELYGAADMRARLTSQIRSEVGPPGRSR